MEDLFETITRLENLKNLARKRQKKKASLNPKRSRTSTDDSMLSTSLLDAMGGLDFGSSYGDPQSFYDVDSALAARRGDSLSDLEIETSHLLDDGIGVDS